MSNPRNDEQILQESHVDAFNRHEEAIYRYADAAIHRDKFAGWPVNRQPSDHDLACNARGRYEGPMILFSKERK